MSCFIEERAFLDVGLRNINVGCCFEDDQIVGWLLFQQDCYPGAPKSILEPPPGNGSVRLLVGWIVEVRPDAGT
jgi:hypothetical protein